MSSTGTLAGGNKFDAIVVTAGCCCPPVPAGPDPCATAAAKVLLALALSLATLLPLPVRCNLEPADMFLPDLLLNLLLSWAANIRALAGRSAADKLLALSTLWPERSHVMCLGCCDACLL